MTRIELSFDGSTMRLKAAGHAGKSANEDINLCCAGLSMLIQTAIELVQRYAEAGIIEEMNVRNESGRAELKAKAYNADKEKLQTLYDYLRAGFDLIKSRYPDKIIWGEKI